jgi:hypothetical protein
VGSGAGRNVKKKRNTLKIRKKLRENTKIRFDKSK